MVTLAGLEPATLWFVVKYSNPTELQSHCLLLLQSTDIILPLCFLFVNNIFSNLFLENSPHLYFPIIPNYNEKIFFHRNISFYPHHYTILFTHLLTKPKLINTPSNFVDSFVDNFLSFEDFPREKFKYSLILHNKSWFSKLHSILSTL